MAQKWKCLPAIQETQVRSLGREDPLEKEMAAHSSTLTWKIPWMKKHGRLSVHKVTKSQTWLSDFTFTFLSPSNCCHSYANTYKVIFYHCFNLHFTSLEMHRSSSSYICYLLRHLLWITCSFCYRVFSLGSPYFSCWFKRFLHFGDIIPCWF